MRAVYLSAVASLLATTAFAGGVDRSGQSILAIFEKGTYAELSLGVGFPSVSGTAVAGLGGFSSGNMAESFLTVGAALKQELRPGLDIGLIIDQPFGANVDYPTGTGYFAGGSTATLSSLAVTGLVKYTLPSNVSLIGGLRYQSLAAEANIPFIAGYTVDGASDAGFGYVLGVAYEKPEIALRVALTYNSKISHNLDTVEFAGFASTTPIDAPQSLNLEFQSGVAANTLVFGSIRWVDWDSFVIDPVNYPAPAPLVSYAEDTISYALGVGRKFSDTWSGAITLGYEDPTGGFASNLGPTDGYYSVGLGATYTRDNMKITGGIRYVDVGDAQTTLNGVTAASNFNGNQALAAGVKVGFSF